MADALDIIIGVDPHKASWTAAAVDRDHRVHGILRVASSAAGYRELRVFAAQWPGARWAIEGGAGLGRPLAHRLLEEHIDDVVDVPAKLSARVRALGHGHGRKTDAADAVSTAIAARTTATLQRISLEKPSDALRLLSDRRDDLVAARTQTVNRLHAALTALIPGGAPTTLTAPKAAELLRTVRPRELVAKTRRAVACDLLADLRRLDGQLKALDRQLAAGVKASATGLTDLYGLGPVLAARILGRVGDISRFPSAAHFASYCGTAPIDVSSGDTARHRLSRAGDRALNHALHIMAITQARGYADGRAYYLRKRQAGKSHNEALRCLKRRLSDVIYRQLQHDHRAIATGPGGQPGATLTSSAAGSTPTASSSDQSLPGPATADSTAVPHAS